MPRPRNCRFRVRWDVDVPRPRPTAWLTRELRRLASLAGADPGEINVVVVNDARMASVHEQYTGVPGTTDVLTFDLRDDPADPLHADLLLCYDEAVRQAAQRGHDARLELLLYALHGLLHLLGYGDKTAAAARKMHAREDELLTAAGHPPVYRGAQRSEG